MRKYILFIIFLLLAPVYLWATDGVSTVEHPAKVNSVATPDKVNTVEGLAAGGGGHDLEENFTDCSDLTKVSDDNIDCSSGYGTVATWGKSIYYHNTSLGSANQEVYATVTYDDNGTSDEIGIILRSDGSTYYKALITYSGYVQFRDNTGSGGSSSDESLGNGTYTLKASINGTAYSLSINGVEKLSGSISQVSSGNYCGVYISSGSGGTQKIDDLVGDAL